MDYERRYGVFIRKYSCDWPYDFEYIGYVDADTPQEAIELAEIKYKTREREDVAELKVFRPLDGYYYHMFGIREALTEERRYYEKGD